MVNHFLLNLFSEKYYCTATLKRVKNPSKSRRVSFYKRELRPLNGYQWVDIEILYLYDTSESDGITKCPIKHLKRNYFTYSVLKRKKSP
jgi:hypothetical protein